MGWRWLGGLVAPWVVFLEASHAATWDATGPLAHARVWHTATLLSNGKVLAAGGGDPGFPISINTAELYDPATGTWTATGSLAISRIRHTATLLSNGKVLAAAGYPIGQGNLSSCELYDPSTGTWSASGSLNQGRFSHSGTLLANGKVLIAGGTAQTPFGSIWYSSAELYDPVTGRWSATGSMATTRYFHTATLLSTGKVLVAGGAPDNFDSTSGAELYDPTKGSWSTTTAMISARDLHTATLLQNGKVLVVGGIGSGNVLSSAELYDPANGTWTAAGLMSVPRGGHTATLLPDGSVLAAGGGFISNVNTAFSNADLYKQSPPDYNLISIHSFGSGKAALSFIGNPGANYALERTLNLSPIDWTSLTTNVAGADGTVTFTDTPQPDTNNFWRVRSVP